MSLATAFQGHEAKYRAQVMHATWGHLEAKHQATHKGWFVFSIAAYGGDHVLLDSEWEGLDDSPGLFSAMKDYLARHGERGKVHRFTGQVTRLKNGTYRFSGKRHVIRLKPPRK